LMLTRRRVFLPLLSNSSFVFCRYVTSFSSCGKATAWQGEMRCRHTGAGAADPGRLPVVEEVEELPAELQQLRRLCLSRHSTFKFSSVSPIPSLGGVGVEAPIGFLEWCAWSCCGRSSNPTSPRRVRSWSRHYLPPML
jgi:hypothetical protein